MKIEELKKKSFEDLTKIKTSADLKNFRNKYLVRKGEVSRFLRSLKDMPVAQRKKIGPEANKLKQELEKAFKEKSRGISPRRTPFSRRKYKT